MNVRLYDGTVRCPQCFDASSYESDTSDPCLYCQSAPEPTSEDEEWLNALCTLVIDQPTRTLTVSKIQCDRCANPGAWKISDGFGKVEQLCTDHGTEWFPHLFPVAKVTVS